MARTLIDCPRCGQQLSMPAKKGMVECPTCSKEITLSFAPKVVYTPPWLNKKFGFFLMFVALMVYNNVMWLEPDLLGMLAQMICFAGILVVALSDLIRNRGRLLGDQAYPNPTLRVPSESDVDMNFLAIDVAPEFGTKFYVAIVVPLLVVPVSFLVPSMLDWCRHPAFRTCNEVGTGAYNLMFFLPFATSLAVMAMGMRGPDLRYNEILAGVKISAVLTFAFFVIMSFMMLTISPY